MNYVNSFKQAATDITLDEIIFMFHVKQKRRFLRPLPLVLGLLMIPSENLFEI